MLPHRNTCPPVTYCGPEAQAVTPLELADFTSGMPDDPPNLSSRLEQRSIEHYTTKDFLSWVSRWKPVSAPPRRRISIRMRESVCWAIWSGPHRHSVGQAAQPGNSWSPGDDWTLHCAQLRNR